MNFTEDLPLQAIMQNFLDSLEGNSILHSTLNEYFEPCLRKLLQFTLEVKTTLLGMIQNAFSLIKTAQTFHQFCEKLIKGFVVLVVENQKSALTESLCQILNVPVQQDLEFTLINDQFTRLSPVYEKTASGIVETSELQLNAQLIT